MAGARRCRGLLSLFRGWRRGRREDGRQALSRRAEPLPFQLLVGFHHPLFRQGADAGRGGGLAGDGVGGEAEEFTAASLPGPLDEESRLVLARRLLREGFLTAATAPNIAPKPTG